MVFTASIRHSTPLGTKWEAMDNYNNINFTFFNVQ